MRRSILFAAAIVLAASCTNSFKVSGTVNGTVPEGAYVSVMDKDYTEIETAEITDGKFSFELPEDVENPYIAAMMFDGQTPGDEAYSIVFIPEKGKAEIVLGEEESVITGSPVSEAFNKFQKDASDGFMGLSMLAQQAYIDGDVAAADSLQQVAINSLLDICRETFEANKDNYVGLNALQNYLAYNEELSISDAEAMVAEGGRLIKENESIDNFLKSRKAKEKTAVGSSFVEIVGKTAKGDDIKLSDFVGKGGYVLLDFWASWCGPCMNAVPNLRSYLEKYQDKGFQLVGVNCWERSEGAGQKKAEQMNMTWPVIFAENDQVEAYGVEAIPTLVLFAPDGTIAGRFTGEGGLEELLTSIFE